MAFVIRGRGEAGALTRAEIRPLTEPLIELAVRMVHTCTHAHTQRPPLGGAKPAERG